MARRLQCGRHLRDGVDGKEPFRIELLPPPRFTVDADRRTVEPGEPVTVRFGARTTGTTVESCSVTLGVTVACDPETLTAVLPISKTQAQGSTPIKWKLIYRSTRPGETGGTGDGEVAVEVVVQPRQFVVTIQPGSAAPGDPVTLTFTPASRGVAITGCLAVFAHAAGDVCRRSTRRWFAATRVPLNAEPGPAVLRWGIVSRNANGAEGSDNGALDYEVLPPATEPPKKDRTKKPTEPTGPTGSAKPTGSAEPPFPPVETEFVAVTDPESARPGDRVVVEVSPADAGAELRGCRAGFSGSASTACRPTAGGWAATVTVPRSIGAGPRSLRWEATSRTAGGVTDRGNGVIDYEVLGDAPAAAAFSVLPEPVSAAPGTKIKLAHASLVDGVEVTGCSAGFTPEDMSDCHRTEEGWIADLTVPGAQPPGRTKVSWRLAYQRLGETDAGRTNGLTIFEVLPAGPEPEPGLLAKIWRLLGRGLLAGIGLVAPFAFAPVRRYFRRLFSRAEPADIEDAVDVRAEAVERPETVIVTVKDRAAPAVHLVSVIPRKNPVLHEEVP